MRQYHFHGEGYKFIQFRPHLLFYRKSWWQGYRSSFGWKTGQLVIVCVPSCLGYFVWKKIEMLRWKIGVVECKIIGFGIGHKYNCMANTIWKASRACCVEQKRLGVGHYPLSKMARCGEGPETIDHCLVTCTLVKTDLGQISSMVESTMIWKTR